MDPTCVVGWLRKNHVGNAFGSDARTRFFTSEGFHVKYYADDRRKTIKGYFDLRNVVSIAPTPPAEAPDAVTLQIAEGSAARIKKTLVVSFSDDPAARVRWLLAWCSAINDQTLVDAALHSYITPSTAERFNAIFAAQRGIGSTRSLFSKQLAGAGLLSPRLSVSAAELADESTLDTPRNSAPASPQQSYEVTVPEGAREGDQLKMTLPTGISTILTVPDGAVPGSTLTFELPPVATAGSRIEAANRAAEVEGKAAVHIQAHVRGRSDRKQSATLEADAPATGAITGAPADPISPSKSADQISPSKWEVQSPLREPPAAPAEAPMDSSTPAEARTLLQTYQASPNTAREFEVAAIKLQSVMRGNADRKQSAKLRAARPTSDPSSANEAKVEQAFGCRTS
jgi:hypothetical protein|eukprot:jgi/Chrpa1/4803/Chrysochromulina_OHIO_Genome00008379-RA